MTLRTRIAAASALILAVAVIVVGIVVSQLARSALIDPIDQRLERLASGFVERSRAELPGPGPGFVGGASGSRPEGRDTAIMRFVGDRLEFSVPSGFDTEPDPLPDVSATAATSLGVGKWRLVQLSSSDGSLDFRAAVIVTGSPRTVNVFARPLDTVDATVDRLRATVFAVGFAVLLVGGASIWLIVRRSLRPVSDTIAIAARIGAGDLSLRVPEPAQPEELRSLGRSINSMLGEIEKSQHAESAAREALTQFVADASHELRTPIAAISGHAELVTAGALDAEGSDRSLARISAEAARMQRLVDDLLTLASHDTGHRLPHRSVNLSDIVTDAVEDARAIDASRTYESEIEPAVRVHGDETQLLQVVANLLANIRTHTPAGTAARVELGTAGGSAVLRVSDDGPGIPPEQQAMLFERFFRAGTGAPSQRGAGLGLAIVSALVDEHSGTVTVESGPGSTCFEVRLALV